MKTWKAYIKDELKKEPGILLLAYPYTFLWKPVSDKKVRQVWGKPNSFREKAVYIHVPFCRNKCLFCNFVSYFNAPSHIISRYVECLIKEMKALSSLTEHLSTDSLCLGGGTPNLLDEGSLKLILKSASDYMHLNKGTEISMEIYPDDSMEAGKLKLLRDCGINRISLGIQSFDNKIKKACKRFDTKKQNVRLYDLSRKAGFNNINLDLMFGLPGQSPESLLDSLTLAVKLSPEHISVYPLSARHPQVSFYKQMKGIEVRSLIDTFNFIRRFLTGKGYFQISRYWYVKKGASYRYNECCSDLVPWLGIGLNSISYNSNFIYKNTPDLKKYMFDLDNGILPVEKGYTLRGKDIISNYIIRKITYLKIDRNDFKRTFGKDIMYYFRDQMIALEGFGLIKIGRGNIELTPKGIFYEALVKRCFYDYKILRKKEEFYKNKGIS
jgi:oxygen-independent coproporphyrinogen III oxidase